jgi:hypothetical protein
VGHAGLAIDRLHGTPDLRRIEAAARLGLDRLELDLCHTADGTMVVRHDDRLEPRNVARPHLLEGRAGSPVASTTLSELRRLDPEVMTIDDAVDAVGRRVPLLLDLKMASVAPLLGSWLAGRRDTRDFAVCTESATALHELGDWAPQAERWPTFPAIGRRRREHVGRVLGGLWQTNRDLRRAGRSLRELGRAVRLSLDPAECLGVICGLPWRSRLPDIVARRSRELRASGLCIQHWLISPELCERAQRLGLTVTAFTVNDLRVARQVVDCGVTMITTDSVPLLRRALRPSGERMETIGR